jgi:hypothetical protein
MPVVAGSVSGLVHVSLVFLLGPWGQLSEALTRSAEPNTSVSIATGRPLVPITLCSFAYSTSPAHLQRRFIRNRRFGTLSQY